MCDNELVTAVLDFEEAQKRMVQRRKVELLTQRLEGALRTAFREQGGQFVRRLRSLQRFFPASEAHEDPWVKALEFQKADFFEALSGADWLVIFYEVVQKTLKLFGEPIDFSVKQALEFGALAAIGSLGMDLSFDLAHRRAVDYLRDYAAAQVTKINETTREYLNTLITQAADEGWSYKRTAEAIIERYDEFAVGRPQLHIDSRAHMIAVNETGNAYAEGNLIIAQDLAAAGLVMEKFWSTVGDDRVSEGCRENEAAGWIPLEKPFPSGHQRPLRHPACRCDLLTQSKTGG